MYSLLPCNRDENQSPLNLAEIVFVSLTLFQLKLKDTVSCQVLIVVCDKACNLMPRYSFSIQFLSKP